MQACKCDDIGNCYVANSIYDCKKIYYFLILLAPNCKLNAN